MRELHDHQVNGCNEAIKVTASDIPGHGGACPLYHLEFDKQDRSHVVYVLHFQEGPIQEVGVNGITHEALLAILIDRLRGFQSGPYACRENALALTKLEESLHWLKQRTEERLARGVEGTHEK